MIKVGNTWQNTKGNEFSVPNKYVLKEKNYRSNIVFREIWGEEHNTSYLQSCLHKSHIVYPRFRLHLTKASHILFVLKISQNMPADTESTFYCWQQKRHGLQWEVYFNMNEGSGVEAKKRSHHLLKTKKICSVHFQCTHRGEKENNLPAISWVDH